MGTSKLCECLEDEPSTWPVCPEHGTRRLVPDVAGRDLIEAARDEASKSFAERRHWDAGPCSEPAAFAPVTQADIWGDDWSNPAPPNIHVALAQHIASHAALRREQQGSGNPKDYVGDTKPQPHLVPAALTIEVARAMADGARKYGPYNWREHPVRMTVYLSAMERHRLALQDGENLTRDSKVKHLAAIGANVAILLDAEATGNLIDDRPLPGPAGDLIEAYTEQAA